MNIRIVRDDSVLHVVHSPGLYPPTIGAIFLLFVLGRFGREWFTHVSYGRFAWDGLAVLVALRVYLEYLSPRDYEFDKAAQKLTWRRRWRWWVKPQELPFEDITEAAVELDEGTLFGRKCEDWELVLRTKEKPIVICDADSAKERAQCEEIAARIREALRKPKTSRAKNFQTTLNSKPETP